MILSEIGLGVPSSVWWWVSIAKRERTGMRRVSYTDLNLNISTEMLLNEKPPSQFCEFPRKVVQMGALQKLQNSINFVAYLPNPYKLSILGDIWRSIILPFSSSKCCYPCLKFCFILDIFPKYMTNTEILKILKIVLNTSNIRFCILANVYCFALRLISTFWTTKWATDEKPSKINCRFCTGRESNPGLPLNHQCSLCPWCTIRNPSLMVLGSWRNL